MQIAGLGFVNSLVIPKNSSEKSTEKSDFASLFTGMIETVQSGNGSELLKEAEQQLSKEEISELMQFLQSTDLTDLENGSLLIDQLLLSDNLNVAEVIKNSLKITDEALVAPIISFIKGLSLTNDVVEDGFTEDQLSVLLDELPDMDAQEALMSFVQFLPNVNIDEISFKLDESFSDLTKSLKLLELLSNYEQTNANQQSLKQFLQKLGEQLELLLNEEGDGSTNSKEFLHKILTPIVKEINQQTILKHSAPSVSNSTNQQIEKINYETITTMSNSKPDSSNAGVFFFQQMSKPEQLTMMLDSSSHPVSTDQLIQQFEEILSKSQLFKTGGTQKLFIKLNPDHLGALKVELIQKESAIIAKIVTTSGTAKDLLESQIQSLKQAFSLQNIPVERIEISQQMTQQERFFNKDSQQQQEQRQQREQEEQQQQDQPFDISFSDALLNARI